MLNQNKYASWEFAQAQGNHTLPQPTLSILPTEDPVADWVLAAKLMKSAELIPNLTTEVGLLTRILSCRLTISLC